MKSRLRELTERGSSILVIWSTPKMEQKLLGMISTLEKGITDISVDRKPPISFKGLKNYSTISPRMFNAFWKGSYESPTY